MAKFQIDYEALDADENKKEGIPYEEFLEWIETLVFSFFAVILVLTFIVRQVNVDGSSMVPTLEDGDKLIAVINGESKAKYRNTIYFVEKENGAGNPRWKGAEFGEWTADIDAAKALASL